MRDHHNPLAFLIYLMSAIITITTILCLGILTAELTSCSLFLGCIFWAVISLVVTVIICYIIS